MALGDQVSYTAAFGAGLPSHIKVRIVHEDPTHGLQIARAFAKQHETYGSSVSGHNTFQLAATVADKVRGIKRVLRNGGQAVKAEDR